MPFHVRSEFCAPWAPADLVITTVAVSHTPHHDPPSLSFSGTLAKAEIAKAVLNFWLYSALLLFHPVGITREKEFNFQLAKMGELTL